MTAGKILWRELIAANRESALAFYRDLLGWNVTPIEMGADSGPYPMVRLDDTGITGFDTSDGSDAPPHWLVYIAVPDSVEAAVARALSNGATVVRPAQDLHGIGRYAVLRDPDGAVFAAFDPSEPGEESAPSWPPAPGAFSWYAIAGTDLATTAGFYADVFGYDRPDPAEEFSIINTPVLTTGASLHAGVLPASDALTPQWIPYIVVTDADQILTRSIDLGGKPITPVMAIPQIGRIVGITDPTGATFFAHEPEQTSGTRS